MDFASYKKLQEEGSGWSYGSACGDQMEQAILSYLSDKPKDAKIIDVGCGEGRGLRALRDLGFTNLVGIDLSTPKINKAKACDLEVYEVDFHDMSRFSDREFDYLFCSHAIEHSIEPEKVLKESLRISKNGLFIVPIDSKDQPPLGQSLHTHNFYSDEQWIELWSSVFTFDDIESYHSPTSRISREIWSYYYEI